MGKLVKFNVVDGTGAAAAGQTVIAGTTELKTGTSGIVQALLDDGDTKITVNGVVVYEGPVASLNAVEMFTTKGTRPR